MRRLSTMTRANPRWVELETMAKNVPMSTHRHNTPLRGIKAVPRPAENNPDYRKVNYDYAGREGHIHEVVTLKGRQLAKVGFSDRKIVYYLLDDLELDNAAKRGTFHDTPPQN